MRHLFHFTTPLVPFGLVGSDKSNYFLYPLHIFPLLAAQTQIDGSHAPFLSFSNGNGAVPIT